MVARLRGEDVLCEVLPFARAYHTPGFAAVLGPIAAFFDGLTIPRPAIPIYSCAIARPDARTTPEAIRGWPSSSGPARSPSAQTIEAMYADGLRIFVDVGARGNLAGFVQDTLRGRPAFAVATNLPRRSGPTQLNHLVASLFARASPSAPIPLRPPAPASHRLARSPGAGRSTVRSVGSPRASAPLESPSGRRSRLAPARNRCSTPA